VDGSRSQHQALAQLEFWRNQLEMGEGESKAPLNTDLHPLGEASPISSNFSRSAFVAAVERALRYIHAGDIYQVNLAQRLAAPSDCSGWNFPTPRVRIAGSFSAYLDCGDFQIVSSSPELFLRLNGSHILTRPIKGTRPRSADPTRDAQLTYELQTSPKEMAELVMITDLLRNDLGRVCEYGSVQVPELVASNATASPAPRLDRGRPPAR